jgi:cytochrome d ubiquinol oxidase subunit II
MEYRRPIIYMGLAPLIYVALNGYGLGVGMLVPLANEAGKNMMLDAIGPPWGPDESCILLGAGVLLIPFPVAHGIILACLYLPVTIMLMALILMGVACGLTDRVVGAGLDARRPYHRPTELRHMPTVFGAYRRDAAPALPDFRLLRKTEGELRDKAIKLARMSIWPMGLAFFMASIVHPLISGVADKWFTLSNGLWLIPIPLVCMIFYGSIVMLPYKPRALTNDNGWLMYTCNVATCLMTSFGLAYSIFPDIVIGGLSIWESAASVKSLQFTLVGVTLTLPAFYFYTFFVYRIFHGKAPGCLTNKLQRIFNR